MKIKRVLIAGIMLSMVCFLGACKGKTEGQTSLIHSESIKESAPNSSTEDMITKENESSDSAEADIEPTASKPVENLSKVGELEDIVTESSEQAAQDVKDDQNDSNHKENTDKEQTSDTKNNNTLGELADVPEL